MSPTMRDAFGYPVRGVRRTELLQHPVNTAEIQGIPIHWDHRLIDIEQSDGGVKAIFANGFTDTSSFLVTGFTAWRGRCSSEKILSHSSD
jgi:salicylate hydroxylase